MDPQQRLLLQVYADARASLAAAPGALFSGAKQHDWGVYVGVSALEYLRMTAATDRSVSAFRSARAPAAGAHGDVSCWLPLPAFVVLLLLC